MEDELETEIIEKNESKNQSTEHSELSKIVTESNFKKKKKRHQYVQEQNDNLELDI